MSQRESAARRRLSHAALSGAFWLTVARGSVRGANFLAVIVLARLLTPSEYGTAAVLMVIAGFLSAGTLGLQAAVVQREGPIDSSYVAVAWTYDRLFFNLLLSLAIFLGAPAIGKIFAQPALPSMVRVLAAVPVVQGFENYALIASVCFG